MASRLVRLAWRVISARACWPALTRSGVWLAWALKIAPIPLPARARCAGSREPTVPLAWAKPSAIPTATASCSPRTYRKSSGKSREHRQLGRARVAEHRRHPVRAQQVVGGVPYVAHGPHTARPGEGTARGTSAKTRWSKGTLRPVNHSPKQWIGSLVAVAALLTALAATPAQATERWTTYERPAEFGIASMPNRPIGMPDGVTLRANVQKPDQPGRYPALIVQTPYGKDGGIGAFQRCLGLLRPARLRGRHRRRPRDR